MEIIQENNQGVLLYLNQEGRGIGLKSKLESYKLQDQGLDTVEANEELGYEADVREYDVAASIIKDLGPKSIKLLSNNPDKVTALRKNDVRVLERIPLNPRVTNENIDYLKTKTTRMNHKINLEKSSQLTPEREKIIRFFSRKKKTQEITLFFKQNLNGEIIEKNQEIPGIEKQEIEFIEENLRSNLKTIIETNKQLEENKKELAKREKKALIKPTASMLEKIIENNLYDNFVSIIIPKNQGKKIDNLDKLYEKAKELNYSNLGKLLIAYGSNGMAST